jgi:integrase
MIVATKSRKPRRRTDGLSFRNFDGSWYSSFTGKYLPLLNDFGMKIKGKENEAEARKALARLQLATPAQARDLSATGPRGDATPIALVLDTYLEYLRQNSPSSVRRTVEVFDYFKKFAASKGVRTLGELEEGLMDDFLQGQNWGPTTQATCGQKILTAINYCRKKRKKSMGIKVNPLEDYSLPVAQTRVTYIEIEQEKRIYLNTSKNFGDLIKFLIHTGCRPGEAAKITKLHVRQTAAGMQVVISAKEGHKAARKTGIDRVIYLDQEAENIIKKLMLRHPTGLLFRTPRGKPWRQQNQTDTWDEMRKSVQAAYGKDFFPDDLVPYSCRHTCATRHLENGASIADVAAVLGNTIAVCEKHYAHLATRQNHIWSLVRKNSPPQIAIARNVG